MRIRKKYEVLNKNFQKVFTTEYERRNDEGI